MHNILSNGELVQFAVASNDTGVDSKSLDHWQRSVRADEIKELFKDFPPDLNKAIDEVGYAPSLLNLYGRYLQTYSCLATYLNIKPYTFGNT